jgi:hypothetical protein
MMKQTAGKTLSYVKLRKGVNTGKEMIIMVGWAGNLIRAKQNGYKGGRASRREDIQRA